jgi:tRNA 2-thiouridine synthesizing protein A
MHGCYYRQYPAQPRQYIPMTELSLTELSLIEFAIEVDASGLNCPLPLLRLKKALMEVEIGHVVKIIATDPAAHLDIGVYADQCGHQIVEFTRQENVQVFFIRKN